MALVNCKYCGHEFSDKASKCPACGKHRTNTTRNLIILGCGLAICCIICSLIFLYRNQKVDELKLTAEKYYQAGDFDNVALTYNSIENYWVDMSKERDILQYDINVRDDVIAFYEATTKLKSDIHSGNSIYSSIDSFSKEATKFDELKINKDSEYGKYIDNMKNVSMYPFFKSEFIKNNSKNFDDGLVRSGYIMLIDTYLDEMLSHELPYY